MREVVILIPDVEPEQNVEIEVSINGKKRTIHYKVELLNWVKNEVPPKDKVTVLKHYIEEKEKDWELVEIGAPDDGNIPLMFRRRENVLR
jgi:regulation of enolase protein 1 (concanavalin A-like superfamily)